MAGMLEAPPFFRKMYQKCRFKTGKMFQEHRFKTGKMFQKYRHQTGKMLQKLFGRAERTWFTAGSSRPR